MLLYFLDKSLEEFLGGGISRHELSLPSMEKMLSRLRPVPTSDPFVDKNGKNIEENQILR